MKRNRYTYKGKDYTVAELAEMLNLTESAIRWRLENCHFMIEVVEGDFMNRKKRKIMFQGKEYGLRELSEILHIPKTSLFRKLKKKTADEIYGEMNGKSS